jgi:hypothetical protein
MFCQGLNHVLHEHLTLFRSCTINELVSASIEQEDACHARMKEERKKRHLSGPTKGASPKYRLVYTLCQASRMVPLHLRSGANVHLSRWHHVLQSTYSSLLHLGLRSLLGQAPVLQLWADWALHSRMHLASTGLLS